MTKRHLDDVARVPSSRKASLLWCSFCGKSQEQVAKLIAGPCVYICNECVALCADIIGSGSTPDDDGNSA